MRLLKISETLAVLLRNINDLKISKKNKTYILMKNQKSSLLFTVYTLTSL